MSSFISNLSQIEEEESTSVQLQNEQIQLQQYLHHQRQQQSIICETQNMITTETLNDHSAFDSSPEARILTIPKSSNPHRKQKRTTNSTSNKTSFASLKAQLAPFQQHHKSLIYHEIVNIFSFNLTFFYSLKPADPAGNEYIFGSNPLCDRLLTTDAVSSFLAGQFDGRRQPVWAFKSAGKQSINLLNGEIRMLCVTWNMNGLLPLESIKSLLNTEQCKHHIVIVASQECERSIPLSFICESKERWQQSLQSQLGESYTIISSVTMNAMHLIAFVHETIAPHVYSVGTDSIGTGILGKLTNKGSIAISFEIGQTSYLFLNSHFAAGQQQTLKRNTDYAETLARINLPKYYTGNEMSLVDRFDCVVWMGDFNYRIDAESSGEVADMLDKNRFFELLKLDSLHAQIAANRVFKQFNEGLILFPPSYRMEKHTNQLIFKNANARIPGWTDRILFRTKQPVNLKLINYEMALNVFGSDHRPVFAQFVSEFKPKQQFRPVPIRSTSFCSQF